MKKLLRPKEVADLLGISPYTLLEWRQVGFGPAFLRLRGNDLRYDEATLKEWIGSREARSIAEERARGDLYTGAAGRGSFQ